MSEYEPLMLTGAFPDEVIPIDFIDKAGAQCDAPVLKYFMGDTYIF